MRTPAQGAVLGHPIGHSKSPALHHAAYRLLGCNFSYNAIDVQEAALPALLAKVRAEGNWYGLSLTMPLKNAAVDLVDTITPVAAALGAVNTIVVKNDAGTTSLHGDNTDVAGIVNALRHAGLGSRPRAAVLGGGGTAVSALAALAALEAPEVVLYVRNAARAGGTLEVAQRLGINASLAPFDDAAAALGGFDVVVSTLPPHGADPLAADHAASGVAVEGALLLDVAYDPWPSALASAWERSGGTVVAGIEMLLYQGVEQVKLFSEAGGYPGAAIEHVGDVINVMCDALGIARRALTKQDMAG